MAGSAKSREMVSFAKRVVTRLWTSDSRVLAQASGSGVLTFRRGAHSSVYDKNLDDQIRPTVVPDDLIQPESDKYWAPHPETGVFGPATDLNLSASSWSSNGGEDSVLEQKAWFRPTSLEDTEKPIQS